MHVDVISGRTGRWGSQHSTAAPIVHCPFEKGLAGRRPLRPESGSQSCGADNTVLSFIVASLPSATVLDIWWHSAWMQPPCWATARPSKNAQIQWNVCYATFEISAIVSCLLPQE